MFHRVNGFRHERGRLAPLAAFLPAPVQRLVGWLYWDVYWPSWVNYRLLSNPRTAYLVCLVVASCYIAWSRGR